MAHRQHLTRDKGHPWTGEAGWDMLQAEADSAAELAAYIAAAGRKFWKVWARDQGENRVALYKPSNATADWTDVPGAVRTARLVSTAPMESIQFHLDLTLVALEHHVRSAGGCADMCGRATVAIAAYEGSGKAEVDARNGVVQALPRLYAFLAHAETGFDGSASWRKSAQERLAAVRDCAFPPAATPTAHTPCVPVAREKPRTLRP